MPTNHEFEFENQEHLDEEFVGIVKDSLVVNGVGFERCVFRNCSFSQSSFVGCNFTDCQFYGCDLSLLKLDNSIVSGVAFCDCKLVGIKWYKTSSVFGFRADFKECILDYGNFSEMNLKKLSFEKCQCREVYFNQCDLTLASFCQADLLGTSFTNCNLEKSNFQKAMNYNIDFSLNKVKKAKFSLPEATNLLKQFDIVVNWESDD